MHTSKDTVLLHHHAGTISAFTPHKSNDALMNLRAMLRSPEIKRCTVKAVGDGFLCLKHEGSKPQKDIWYVTNPITKEVLKLPKPPTECECPSGCAYGIGFDGSSGTPKVVRVFFQSYEWRDRYTLGADVYDFRERCWRRPRTSRVSVFPVRGEEERAISASGGIHWFKKPGFMQRRFEARIVSFDLGKEEFSLLRPPRIEYAGDITGLFEVRGSLAIVNHRFETRIEVWVLESSRKWRKSYKINIAAFPDVGTIFPTPDNFDCRSPPDRVRCVGEIDGEMVLVNIRGRYRFSFYNPKQRSSSREFDFEHIPNVRLPHIFAFTPTLISLHSRLG